MSVDRIGRADYELGTDNTGLKRGLQEGDALVKASGQQLEATYKSSAYRAGELVGSGLKGGLKIAGAAATLTFGLATKGIVDLEDATASYRAETGATEAQAKSAGKAINDMSGRNLVPVKDIGRTMEEVTKKLDLTGDAANSTTQDFLSFGRATKQGPAQAVADFDDILDGYGLTAKSIVPIQDQLVKSSQLYGGSVVENQKALGAMAPQLKALNLDYNDGISLLNLFAASGIDAATAQRTLNSAVAKLPAGTTLEDFVAELASIEDPALRAARASEVFGVKAGPAMANAIKPGMQGLAAFSVSAADAAGATSTAAKAMDSSFGAQAQLRLARFRSILVDLGKDFGPVATGLGGIASLAGTLGIDKLLQKFGPALVNGLKAAGQKGGEALADGLSSVWQGAAGTVVGNNIATRFENIFDPDKNTKLGALSKAAGAKIGAIVGAATGAIDKIAGPITSALVKLPGVGAVRAALLAGGIQMGTMQGTAMGAAMGLALKLGVLAAVTGIASAAAGPIKKAGADVHDMLFADDGPLGGVGNALEGAGDWLSNLPWPLGPKGAPAWATFSGENAKGLDEAVVQPVAGALADVNAMTINAQSFLKDVGPAASSGAPGFVKLADAAHDARVDVNSATRGIIASVTGMQTLLAADAQTAADAIWDPQIRAAELAQLKIDLAASRHAENDKDLTKAERREAHLRTLQLEKELFIQQAAVANDGTAKQRVAKQKAELLRITTSKEFTKGTAEQKAALQQQATNLRLILDGEERTAASGGKDVRDGYIGPLKKGGPAAHSAAVALTNGAKGPMRGLASDAYGYGGKTASQYAAGFRANAYKVINGVTEVVRDVRRLIQATSPPVPTSPLHNIGLWGQRTIEEYARGIAAGGDAVKSAVGDVTGLAAAAFGPMGGATFAAAAGSFSSSRTVTIGGTARLEVGLAPGAAEAFRKSGMNEREIAGALRDSIDVSGFLSHLQHVAAIG